ncbi:MAG: GYDIA family GHMP kinase [Aequorivita sp.]
MKKNFHSNGKLLLTGEYVVLDGAKALAIPTKHGQSLEVETSEEKGIQWKSYDEKGIVWFEDFFDLNNFQSKNLKNSISKTLSKILLEAKKLNPNFLIENKGIQVTTKLDFPRNWGLGTSSTLINNIAQWAEVNAFKLLNKSFGGSGYDIAAAQNDSPIIYQLKEGKSIFKKVEIPWDFTDQLFFVHLNQKQDSKEGIAHYRRNKIDKKVINQISDISKKILICDSLSEFEELMDMHEQIISKVIILPPIKAQLFSDYPRAIKSLGAWGGDFVLVTGSLSEIEYFRRKGFGTIISFKDMIK